MGRIEQNSSILVWWKEKPGLTVSSLLWDWLSYLGNVVKSKIVVKSNYPLPQKVTVSYLTTQEHSMWYQENPDQKSQGRSPGQSKYNS